MAPSVHQDRNGPTWPLGAIVVTTPGTPVSIMSLVDSANNNAPGNFTAGVSAEYTPRAQQIIFQGFKPSGASFANNSGNIYIVRKAQGSGAGNRGDTGDIVAIISAGTSFVLSSAALNRNVFSPYDFFIDADNSNDACVVTLIIQ